MIDVMGEALIDLMEVEDGTFRAIPGGSPANVALGIARLGEPCRFLGRFSTDRFGGLSRKRLADAGVDLTAAVSTGLLSTLAVVALDTDASARYTFYRTETADWAWRLEELPDDVPDAFHVGSLTAAIPPGSQVVTEHLARLRAVGGCLISYDPNIRPAITTDHESETARVESQARSAHLVKLSADDLEWLYPGHDADAGVRRLRCAGVDGEVALTMGAAGARLYRSGGESVEVPGQAGPVVDTVGAGDAFSAAVLAELSHRGLLTAVATGTPVPTRVWADVLSFANRAAAVTCRRRGADPPRRSELESR